MKKALVTGGWGFIGSHLVERLIRDGLEVIALDNGVTGKISNLAEFQHHPNLTLVEADIRKPETLKNYFANVDTVFHLAAMADIVPSIENPTLYYETNVLGTLHVLEQARIHGAKKILYTASSSCYGFPDQTPTPETASINSQYPYALTKYLGETTALHWGKVYKMDVVSLRLFNVFGPRHRTTGTYGAVFGVFLAQKLAGKPFTIVGDGTQTRDFTYVTDVADAFVTAARSNIRNEIFNVGSGASYSINYLTELLDGERVFLPKRPGEPDCTFADITKIKKFLNWQPRVRFEKGVQEMLKNIELWSDAPVWTQDSIKDATKSWFRHLS
ncbi:MAG: NAD-dependent dehydratase [Deltaproteobacteria bacterium RIFCSPLOWO2_02_FULL_46_8]|nr:MAG: NAD-dependent dehydratase [Deltaproteobacteria bacterium RIFCSPLOWO2_02_FULL_46_8]